jgi:hypothetical protein
MAGNRAGRRAWRANPLPLLRSGVVGSVAARDHRAGKAREGNPIDPMGWRRRPRGAAGSVRPRSRADRRHIRGRSKRRADERKSGISAVLPGDDEPAGSHRKAPPRHRGRHAARRISPQGAAVTAPDLDDEPLTLDEACRDIFRNTIRPATLRAEAARGNLVIERIGRRDFVTRAAIAEMREKCRQQVQPQKAPAFGSGRSEHAPAASPSPPSGSSGMTEDLHVARDAAQRIADQLKKPSAPTSRKNTRSLPENVIPLNG